MLLLVRQSHLHAAICGIYELLRIDSSIIISYPWHFHHVGKNGFSGRNHESRTPPHP